MSREGPFYKTPCSVPAPVLSPLFAKGEGVVAPGGVGFAEAARHLTIHEDADAMTAATIRSRKEVFAITRALRNLGGVWDGLQIVATAEQIGVRDGRRMRWHVRKIISSHFNGFRKSSPTSLVSYFSRIDASRFSGQIPIPQSSIHQFDQENFQT